MPKISMENVRKSMVASGIHYSGPHILSTGGVVETGLPGEIEAEQVFDLPIDWSDKVSILLSRDVFPDDILHRLSWGFDGSSGVFSFS